MSDLPIGAVLQNEYRIDQVLEPEELGIRYVAYNTRRQQVCTVLMLHPRFAAPRARQAVHRDLVKARTLPGIDFLPSDEVYDASGAPGFATEVLPGESLRARLLHGALPPARALELAFHLAQGLGIAHAGDLIHGDLRPENIFLVDPRCKDPRRGRALLLQHSLHRLRAPVTPESPVARLCYTPPELLSAGEVDGPSPAGDVFLLGAVLHECISGHPAFYVSHPELGEVPEFILEKLCSPIDLLAPDPALGLSQDLCEPLNLLLRATCARDPNRRVASMDEVARALLRIGRVQSYPWALEQATARPRGVVQRLTGIFGLSGPSIGPPAAAAPRPAPPPEPTEEFEELEVLAESPAAVSTTAQWQKLTQSMALAPLRRGPPALPTQILPRPAPASARVRRPPPALPTRRIDINAILTVHERNPVAYEEHLAAIESDEAPRAAGGLRRLLAQHRDKLLALALGTALTLLLILCLRR